MALGASRTKQMHRGKGLLDMRRVLDGLNGTLQIHSGRGFYQYKAGAGREECKNFNKSMTVGGTLVLWELPLAKET
jgi:hypothetical protein